MDKVMRMLRPYVSNWGVDPLWASPAPELPPQVTDFPRRVGPDRGELTLEELPDSVKVVIAPHEVHFDAGERRLWYCDIELNLGDTYYPFVQLGLARYQPQSITNLHLSRVVMTDFVQVAPDRTAQVMLAGNMAGVMVKGYAGRNLGAGQGTKQNTRMQVTLERRLPGIPGDLGWKRVGDVLPLSASPYDYNVTWAGTVSLAGVPLGAGSHRLVITEVETYPRDKPPDDSLKKTIKTSFERERIVYADIFEL